MSYNAALRDWSHCLYGIIQALSISKSADMGNMQNLNENLKESHTWISSKLNYASNLPRQPYRKGAVRLTYTSPEELFDKTARLSVEMLFTNLITLCDEQLGKLLENKGIQCGDYPYNKILKVMQSIPIDSIWAAHGVVEMISIRNAMVHNNRKWNKRSIELITPYVESAPIQGDEIKISFDDLFRFKRAVRTILSQAHLHV